MPCNRYHVIIFLPKCQSIFSLSPNQEDIRKKQDKMFPIALMCFKKKSEKNKRNKESTEKNIGHEGTVFRSASCGESQSQVIMQQATILCRTYQREQLFQEDN